MPCIQCEEKGHNRRNCPNLPCSYCDNSTTHISKNCPVFNLDQKEKRRNITLNDKQIEADRKRHRIVNMTDEQKESQRDRHRVKEKKQPIKKTEAHGREAREGMEPDVYYRLHSHLHPPESVLKQFDKHPLAVQVRQSHSI